jgi:hypothetical protein
MKSGRIVGSVALVSILVAASAVATLEGCSSSSSKAKGGGAKGAAAQMAGQTAGGTATGAMSSATDDGATYEQVTCDASDEDVAWCDSDTALVFCSGGHFYSLDCTTISGDFCGEDGTTIDCYAATDF